MVLLNWWARADVKTARSALFWAIVGICGLFALVLMAAGKGFFAVLPAGFAAWRMFGQRSWDKVRGTGTRQPQSRSGGMSEEEALDVLGLEKGASEEEIQAAYRKLMAQVHPDKGGNDYLAAKINEAKQTLLGR
ncbi:MAG: J domain-containing protein [Alphaproteobacteria bacterium]|nr:J domain-containing protein [Alphaproteobacteria bacterium]